MEEVEIRLKFRVTNRELLDLRAREAVKIGGGGAELDGTAATALVEVLLHSNPGVDSYDQYGVELLR